MNKNPLRDILARTATDKAFREKFLADPAGVLKHEGLQVPEGRQIRVLENTDERMYVVLPADAKDQPASWNRQERPAPGERSEVDGLLMEWKEGGLTLTGRIDSSSAPALRAELGRVSGNVTLEFSDVKFMSSAGLAVLLSTVKRLAADGKQMSLYNVPTEIRNVIALSNLDNMFRFLSPDDFLYSNYMPMMM